MIPSSHYGQHKTHTLLSIPYLEDSDVTVTLVIWDNFGGCNASGSSGRE